MSSEERSLPGQRIRVTLEDETNFEVRITNRELLAWDMTRAKRQWPPFSEAIFLAMTFTSWKAATREKLTALTWDAWSDAVVNIEDVTDEDTDVARPTSPAPAAG